MKLNPWQWLLLVLGLVTFGGCSSGPAPSPPTTTPVELTRLVQVNQIEILKLATEPPQIRVIVHGQLPNPCVKIDNVTVEQNGSQYAATLVTSRLANDSCPETPVDFEKTFLLDGAGLGPGTYGVTVNGVSETFEISGASASPAAPTVGAATTPSPAPEVSPTPVPSLVQGATAREEGCTDKAGFFGDVTVPDNTIFAPEETFVKTWRFRNEGTCTWAGYSLVFAGGDLMGASESTPIATVNPNDIFEVSLQLKAPAKSGVYQSNWWFQNAEGKRFGLNAHGKDLFWVKIVVHPPVAAGGESGKQPDCAYQTNADYESAVLQLINDARTAQGLNTLRSESRLKAAALEHSLDMACNNYVDHYSSDGRTYQTRVSDQGYRYSAVTENIYAGNPAFGGNPDGAFAWWMNSQIHRTAILNPKYTDIGIAYIFNATSQYGGYYTVVFARP